MDGLRRVHPVIGVVSDGCKSRLGRRRPFIIVGCIVSSMAVLIFGRTKEVAGLFATPGGSAVRPLLRPLSVPED